MDKAQSDFDFKVMSLTYRFRDLFSPPRNILGEAGIEQGFHVLDYGCGPGSYTTPLEALVGKSGKIYALDIHPLAIKKVQRIVSKKHLTNVKTIHSDCKTGLPDNSVNVVLLYDILHDLSDPNGVLEELHRVLKPGGILSFTDHHLKEDEILSKVTNKGLFRLSKKGKKTYTFSKEG
ncbi:class I SAM-dependent methyltransferase [candidate division TA06 bacterium]|uniref:Class I SAM-dependent methyltransferase n=1 Tax=candidate division TA06 bacterium TaxID=2250710 RepID=A0A523UVJ7_UNCT6|nr:MAG: class I SAM-dependent methyltransferase [candidate division TA06 bacterium]